MTKSNLNPLALLILAKTEGTIGKLVVNADNPQLKADELMSNSPDGSTLDIRIFNGLKETLEKIGQSYADKEYTGVLKVNKRGDKTSCLVVCKLSPSVLETEPTSQNDEVTNEELTPLQVFRAESKSGADVLLLVAARNIEQATSIITDSIIVDLNHVNLKVDVDYYGIQGEPRVLENMGFNNQ